ncbi:LPS assembly lipoprotein LptE [uncultured Thiothrix sp.]|uniref:LPS-assembly lipoprotein LptE n=1 Tax=uncultured Thiothrix sp. TaxID=223185 RepID=UPI00260E20C3|nr:LPS assembly lipoprotein LptE [uncultured Thiothrix sp.]
MLLRLVKNMISLLLVLMLAACAGFQLRGADSALLAPLKGQQVAVQGLDVNSSFSKKLRTALEQAGASVATDSPATMQLTITDFKEEKTATAYSAARQVREFNHYLNLHFTAEAKDKPELKPLESSLHVERNQIYDSRYVLGVSEEERSIQAELETEAARLLALRLAALR